jgi:hypothetical protein
MLMPLMKSKKNEPTTASDQFTDEEIERRRDKALLRALNTPPKRHSEMKIGKRKTKGSQKGVRQKARIEWVRGFRMVIRALAAVRLCIGRCILWLIVPARNEELRPTIENIENIRRLFGGKP